jgi:hypothetical protein
VQPSKERLFDHVVSAIEQRERSLCPQCSASINAIDYIVGVEDSWIFVDQTSLISLGLGAFAMMREGPTTMAELIADSSPC